jgi:hypothetical protein
MCFLHSVRNMFKLYILAYLSILQIAVQFVGLLYKPAKGGLSSGFCESVQACTSLYKSVQVPSSLLMHVDHLNWLQLYTIGTKECRCRQRTLS